MNIRFNKLFFALIAFVLWAIAYVIYAPVLIPDFISIVRPPRTQLAQVAAIDSGIVAQWPDLSFTGGAGVSIPDGPSLDGMPALTVTGWVELAQLGKTVYVVNKRNSTAPWSSYGLSIGANNVVSFQVNISSTTGKTAGGSTALQANQWYYFTGVYDGANAYIYVNASREGYSAALSGNVFNSDGALWVNYPSGMNGSLHDVRVYNRALAASEVASLYALGAPSSSQPATTTATTTTPVISGVGASNITATGATISWTTDKVSSSQVEYGLTTSYGSQTALDSTMILSHSVALSGLAANTVYHYRVHSTDSSNNQAISSDQTFTTSSATQTTTQTTTTPTTTTQTTTSDPTINQGFATSSGGMYGNGIIPSSRMTDWTTAGVIGPDGSKGIPNFSTVCATIDASIYGNGSTDATAAIQNAADNCPSEQVVYLPAGTYLISGHVTIKHPVVLRGAGPRYTKLISNGNAIIFTSATPPGVSPYTANNVEINIVGGSSKGSTSLTLDSVANLSVGQEVIVDELNDPSLVSLTNEAGTMTGQTVNVCAARVDISLCYAGGAFNPRNLGQMVRIKSINANTNVVTIDTPLYFDFQPGLSPQIFFWKGGNLRYAGIENLKVDGQFYDNAITFNYCTNCWAKNIEVDHMKRGAVTAFYDYHLEVRDSYFYKGYSDSPENYVIELDRTSGSLVENNIVDSTIAGFELGFPNSGDVIGYNYSVRDNQSSTNVSPVLFANINSHDPHNYMNLFEGNIVAVSNFDHIWGSGSHETVFRSRLSGYLPPVPYTNSLNPSLQYYSNYNWPVIISSWNRYVNFVGNVLGTPGVQTGYQAAYAKYAGPTSANTASCASPTCILGVGPIYVLGFFSNFGDMTSYDSVTPDTLLRWGNYDYYTNKVHFDATEIPSGVSVPGTQSLPASLYLSSKPSWFGATAWPAIGPDVSGFNNDTIAHIPAQVCYNLIVQNGYFDAGNCYYNVNTAAFTIVDNIPPTVSMSAPANGATVSGSSVVVSATASDNVAVAGVQFQLDSLNLGSEDVAAPYQVLWDTTAAANGQHTLLAIARDTSNNFATSTVTQVTVSNTVVINTAPPTLTVGSPSGTLPANTGSATLSLSTDKTATCKYDTAPGTAYLSMPNTFAVTGNITHSTLVSGLSNGQSYAYYVRCQDSLGNMNTSDFVISFSVASALSAPLPISLGVPVQTTAMLNVRDTPNTAGNLLVTLPPGVRGTVADGPQIANGFTWWKVKYGLTWEGWSVDSFLNALPDSDMDGVADDQDLCPLTPIGVSVNKYGCPEPSVSYFDIKPDIYNQDLRALTSFELGNTAYGKILFATSTTAYSLVHDTGTYMTPLDFNTNVIIQHNKITLVSSALPELNKPATLTLYGVTVQSPNILRDGSPCTNCRVVSYSNGTLVFTVSGFSTYEVTDGSTSQPQSGGGGGGGGGGGPISSAAPLTITASSSQSVILPSFLYLPASVSDPIASVFWSMLSGPGTVTFSDNASASTTAAFSDQGSSYVLRLTAAKNGLATTTADIAVTAALPTHAPLRSGGAPAGMLLASSTVVSLTTDTSANCYWSNLPNTPFELMSNIFTTTGDVSHSLSLSNISPGVFTYFVRCRDSNLNTNQTDYPIFFSYPAATSPDKDTTAPRVALIPIEPSVRSEGTTTISAAAADETSLNTVSLFADNKLLATLASTTASFSTSWYATAGTHTLTAVAKDLSGNTATSSALTLNIISPNKTAAPVIAPAAPVPAPTPKSAATAPALNTTAKANAKYRFSKTLRFGMKGEDVKALQVFLNGRGFIIASTGPGSPGKETGYFGLATRAALVRFQEANRSVILTPFRLSQGTGYFGLATMALVNNLAAPAPPSPTTQTVTPAAATTTYPASSTPVTVSPTITALPSQAALPTTPVRPPTIQEKLDQLIQQLTK